MSSSTEPSQAQVPYTGFPASDLRQPKRLVTSHNEDGKGVFLPEDDGDHHRVILDGTAVCNIIYSTQGNPVNLNEDADVKRAKDNEPAMTVPRGTIARMIDFAPGMTTPFHRSQSLDYGIVIEGEFKMTLDGGESKIMLPGDITVNRACNHLWTNMSATKSGRMMFVLLDAEPLVVGGRVIKEDLGDLGGDYTDQERE